MCATGGSSIGEGWWGRQSCVHGGGHGEGGGYELKLSYTAQVTKGKERASVKNNLSVRLALLPTSG